MSGRSSSKDGHLVDGGVVVHGVGGERVWCAGVVRVEVGCYIGVRPEEEATGSTECRRWSRGLVWYGMVWYGIVWGPGCLHGKQGVRGRPLGFLAGTWGGARRCRGHRREVATRGRW